MSARRTTAVLVMTILLGACVQPAPRVKDQTATSLSSGSEAATPPLPTPAIPTQPFEVCEKTVHAERWDPLSAMTILKVTLYGLCFSAIYFVFALLCFRRRAL